MGYPQGPQLWPNGTVVFPFLWMSQHSPQRTFWGNSVAERSLSSVFSRLRLFPFSCRHADSSPCESLTCRSDPPNPHSFSARWMSCVQVYVIPPSTVMWISRTLITTLITNWMSSVKVSMSDLRAIHIWPLKMPHHQCSTYFFIYLRGKSTCISYIKF